MRAYSLSLLAILSVSAHADVVGLAWDASPSTTVAGYKVYWGTAEYNPFDLNPNGTDVGLALTFTTPDLPATRAYYFTVRAYGYDETGQYLESWNSNVAVKDLTPPPAPVVCPCSLFGEATPSATEAGDNASVELGVRFRVKSPGKVKGVRFYKTPGNTGPHQVNFWNQSGGWIASVGSQNETADGWQTVMFPTAFNVYTGVVYTVSYHAPHGHYAYTHDFFQTAWDSPSLIAPASTEVLNGVYNYNTSSRFPTGSYRSSNYWVDVIFDTQ